MVWLPWPTKMHYLDIVSLDSKHIETSFSHIQQICCAYNSLRCVDLRIQRFCVHDNNDNDNAYDDTNDYFYS